MNKTKEKIFSCFKKLIKEIKEYEEKPAKTHEEELFEKISYNMDFVIDNLKKHFPKLEKGTHLIEIWIGSNQEDSKEPFLAIATWSNLKSYEVKYKTDSATFEFGFEIDVDKKRNKIFTITHGGVFDSEKIKEIENFLRTAKNAWLYVGDELIAQIKDKEEKLKLRD
jgi:hypothetical protein